MRVENDPDDYLYFNCRITLHAAQILMAALDEGSMAYHARASQEIPGSEKEQELRNQGNRWKEWANEVRDAWHASRSGGEVYTMRNDGCAVDQRQASGNSSIVQMESNKLLPWLMLTCLLSGVSIALSIFAIIRSSDATRMSLLAREDIRVFDHALTAHGINTDEHAQEKGERN